ncbi:MAG: hypothetical protein HY868_04755 [Chloroflexi bacterium]|nr:hypothetical protein [Chloroflexota bacterium]
MKIPKYWAQGKYSLDTNESFTAWRWSDTSYEQAQQLANDKAREIALKFQNGQQLDRYSYGRNPLREEIVQSIKNANGNEIGIVTRNLYGALVLNAAQAMFIDIDFSDKESRAVSASERVYLQTIEQWAQAHRDWTLRVYRTFGGMRCLITNEIFDPTQESSLAVLRGLKSDPLYVTLCRQQESFRARLTPKPWRCGANQPPSRYPWENVRQERNYREWEQAYQRAASRFITCRLLKQIGDATTHPNVAPILSTHDEMACSTNNLNLA